MNCTGITRRMDKIGRLQISAEIRRDLGIADAAPLTITAETGRIVLMAVKAAERSRKGHVRHIDALGRITVPSDMRRMLGIRDGDTMEFFTDGVRIIAAKLDTGHLHEECCERMIANLDGLEREVRAKVYQLISEIRMLVRPKHSAAQEGGRKG